MSGGMVVERMMAGRLPKQALLNISRKENDFLEDGGKDGLNLLTRRIKNRLEGSKRRRS